MDKQKEWDIGSLEIIKDAYAIRNRIRNRIKMRLLKYVLSRMTAKLGCGFTSYIIIRTLQDITGENNDILNS